MCVCVCVCVPQFAELEASVGELERSRAIYELAINQPVLDMPELLWKSYIDFEIAQGEHDNVRTLYERLLDRTKHVKVRGPPSAVCVCACMCGPWCVAPRDVWSHRCGSASRRLKPTTRRTRRRPGACSAARPTS